MRERDFWGFIKSKLSSDVDVALLIVAASSDSTPGRKGFKMATASDGSQSGTIGGGIMEYNLLKEIRRNFDEKKYDAEIHSLQHSNETEAEKSGLICGGKQTVIIKYLTSKNLPEVNKICDKFSVSENGLLKITHSQFNFDDNPAKFQDEFILRSKDNWSFTETLGFEETVYIVGSGHVGVAVCRQFAALGFRTVVFDHRNDVFDKIPNLYADEKIVTSYKDVGKYIVEGNKSYVIIVSPQHLGDKNALGSVINKNVKYIGMMGSVKKINTIYELLKKEGIDERLLKNVHAPIGLEISSESPAEIAVSIAAEVIEIKNGKSTSIKVKSI